MPEQPIRILLVEDNLGDVRLLQETLRGGSYAIDVARDGEEGLAYLRHMGRFRLASEPDLILLDLGLPRLDGRQVLAEVRSDPQLNRIPVIILTSSTADDDVRLAFNFHADGYLRKPLERGQFEALLERLQIGG